MSHAPPHPLVARAPWGTSELMSAVRDRLPVSFDLVPRPASLFGDAKVAHVRPFVILIDLEDWARQERAMLPTHEIQTIQLRDPSDGFTTDAELHLCLMLDDPLSCPFHRTNARLIARYAVWCEEA